MNTSTHTYSRGGSASNFFSFSSKGKREETSAPQFYYEKDNHLGSVLATVSDRKLPVDNNSDNIVDFYLADVTSATDYYSFGSIMPGRSFNSNSTRHGFGGQEKDDEITGSSGTHYTAPFWEYDARLGRRWNMDPEFRSFPFESPYAVFHNNPIWYNDPLGNQAHKTGTGNPAKVDRAVKRFGREVGKEKRNNPALTTAQAVDNVVAAASPNKLFKTVNNQRGNEGEFRTFDIEAEFSARQTDLTQASGFANVFNQLTETSSKVSSSGTTGEFLNVFSISSVPGAIASNYEYQIFLIRRVKSRY